jgi:hypothetical protein
MCQQKYQLFATMVIMNILCAWYDTCFGPVIPFFSEATGIDETNYSYLFLVRFITDILGGLLIKELLQRFSSQKLAIIYMLIFAASLTATTFSLSTISLIITVSIATATFVGLLVIALNVTTKIFLDE